MFKVVEISIDYFNTMRIMKFVFNKHFTILHVDVRQEMKRERTKTKNKKNPVSEY